MKNIGNYANKSNFQKGVNKYVAIGRQTVEVRDPQVHIAILEMIRNI